MPISQHLRRKLQEALGAEAAEDLLSRIEDMNALRADMNELRHDMQLGFARADAKVDTKFAEARAELRVVGAELERKIGTSVAELRASMERGLREQTRFLYLGWAVQIAAILGLWLR